MKTLKQSSIKIDFEFNLKFWALTPAFNLNFSSSTFVFEFEWLCIGIYASKVKKKHFYEPTKDGGKVRLLPLFPNDFLVSSIISRNKNNRFYMMEHKHTDVGKTCMICDHPGIGSSKINLAHMESKHLEPKSKLHVYYPGNVNDPFVTTQTIGGNVSNVNNREDQPFK